MTDYTLEGPKWSSSTITYSFAAAGGAFSNAVTGAYLDTVRAAIARWASIANINLVQVPDSPTANIRIGFSQLPGTAVGETDFSYVNLPDHSQVFRTGTLIRLEDPATRPIATTGSTYYQGTASTLYQTVLHEFGHALGLDHSPNPNDVMYASVGPSDPDLAAGDIAGLQAIYGAAPGFAASAPSITATVTATPNTVNLASGVIAVYRFFDSTTGTQFLTAAASEKATVLATRPDLSFEGIAFGGIASNTDPNAVPVYRFFDTTKGTHFFTSSASEESTILKTRSDLVLEQTTFYEHATAQTGDVPVYRFFDKTDGTHFFTASAAERTTIATTRSDMAFEGVAFYAPMTTTT